MCSIGGPFASKLCSYNFALYLWERALPAKGP